MVSMEDANDEMWDRLFALPDMDLTGVQSGLKAPAHR